jgi:hypothetical protein
LLENFPHFHQYFHRQFNSDELQKQLISSRSRIIFLAVVRAGAASFSLLKSLPEPHHFPCCRQSRSRFIFLAVVRAGAASFSLLKSLPEPHHFPCCSQSRSSIIFHAAVRAGAASFSLLAIQSLK